jgi:glycosyltransferase involved in cell wall biosynthesis
LADDFILKTILHVIDTTGPGGAETVFIDLATRLPRDKYRSVVVIRGKGWVYEELCRRGVEPVFLAAKGSFNWRYLWGLIRLIRQENVDLIQSHLLGANVYCSLAGLLTGTPIVATFHGEVDIGEKERLKTLKMRVINAGANQIIAVSGGLRDDMLRRTNLNRDKIAIIYNGIDTSAFQRPHSSSLRIKFGWPDEVFVIGSLGNIRRAKGYDILLKAASLLGEDGRDYRFVIAGQPDKAGLYESLLELRKTLGLEEKVKFLGFLDDSAEYLSNLDLFLSTSTSEGLPLAAIQAMAAGLPLLATRCGGYEELVADQENGWLVEVGDPAAISNAIQTLASTPEVRNELALKAQSHVKNTFDSRIMFEHYQAIYDRIALT